jgi:hypothetical protein
VCKLYADHLLAMAQTCQMLLEATLPDDAVLGWNTCRRAEQVWEQPPLQLRDLSALGLKLPDREVFAAHEAQAVQVRMALHTPIICVRICCVAVTVAACQQQHLPTLQPHAAMLRRNRQRYHADAMMCRSWQRRGV